jgi:hypothetical protein
MRVKPGYPYLRRHHESSQVGVCCSYTKSFISISCSNSTGSPNRPRPSRWDYQRGPVSGGGPAHASEAGCRPARHQSRPPAAHPDRDAPLLRLLLSADGDALLEVLAFRSSNTVHRPLIEALELIKQYAGSDATYYAPEDDPPLDGVIPDIWRDLVVSRTRRGLLQIHRVNYEICVLQALRDKLRCKEIWLSLKDRAKALTHPARIGWRETATGSTCGRSKRGTVLSATKQSLKKPDGTNTTSSGAAMGAGMNWRTVCSSTRIAISRSIANG